MKTITLSLPKPHRAQAKIKSEARRFNVVILGRRAGKTVLGIDRLVEPALQGYPVAWFSPTYKMLSEVWRAVRNLLQPVTAKRDAQEHRIELITGGVVDMWSLDNPDVARGRKYKRIVCDEWAMVANAEEAWQNVIRPTLADYQGDAWFLTTPKGRNFAWTMYQWGIEPAMHEWACWQMPTGVNPFIDPGEIEAMRQEMPEAVFRQEVLAEFLENEGAVFRNIKDCLKAPKGATPDEHRGHHIVAGVDWGKHNDFTAISVVCSTCRREVALDRFNKIDYAFQRERLRALCDAWHVGHIEAESNAMGEPVIEQLQREGLPVSGFQTTATSKPPLIESLALAFEREECQWIDDPVWTGELEAYERKVSATTGRSSYSAPEGLHDDTVMARALAHWALQQTGPLLLWGDG